MVLYNTPTIDGFESEYEKIKQHINSSHFSMPRLPELVFNIDKTLQDENKGIREVANVVKIDPVLTARVIQISNSPLVRGYNRICSLDVAIQRIGLNFLRNLVFCMTMHDKFVTKDTAEHTLLIELWDHSVNVMLNSYVLAKRIGLKPDGAMIAGILHDMGKLPIIEMAADNSWNNEQLPSMLYNLHTFIGGEILRKWDMSEQLVKVATNHHNIYDTDDKEVTYTDVVILADLYGCEECLHAREAIDWDRLVSLKKIDMNKEQLFELFKSTEEEVNEIRKAMFI